LTKKARKKKKAKKPAVVKPVCEQSSFAERTETARWLPLICSVCGGYLHTKYHLRRMLGLDTVCVSVCADCESMLLIRRGTKGEEVLRRAIAEDKS